MSRRSNGAIEEDFCNSGTVCVYLIDIYLSQDANG